MMDRRASEARPDPVEMLQLNAEINQNLDKHHGGLLDNEEIGDLLKETFAKKEEAEPTVGEILAQEDKEE